MFNNPQMRPFPYSTNETGHNTGNHKNHGHFKKHQKKVQFKDNGKHPKNQSFNKGAERFNETTTNKRKPSPIVYDSSDKAVHRPQSPVTLKVTARVDNLEKTPFVHKIKKRRESVFNRLGCSQQPNQQARQHSPIFFDVNEQRNDIIRRNSTPILSSTSRVEELEVVSMPLEVISSSEALIDMKPCDDIEILKKLEDEKDILMTHCDGLRDTVDKYYREITKLEMIIYKWSQEIEIVKKRILR